MPEDLFVDIWYRGLELGQRMRMEDFAEGRAYLHHPAPMPVGSELLIEIAELKFPVRVSRVSEQVAGADRPAGMFVMPLMLDGPAREWWSARDGLAPAAPAEQNELAAADSVWPERVEPAQLATEPESSTPDPEPAREPGEIGAGPEAEQPARAKKKRTRRKKR